MGQGYSVTTPSAGSAGIDVPELGDLVYEKSLGSARFMKSIRARHHDGIALVKVLVKPYTPMALGSYRDKILRERHILANVPNALGYQRIVETETNGYLVRQFLYNSLYDRLSTRPFLEDIEKKWLAFQLLCALRDCHARSVYHGDIKTENVLVTSWNWLYLTDFSASFKPVLLPDDNPADFSYFFDTSGRRTCYLAPERFVPAAVAAEAALGSDEDAGESSDSRREGSQTPRSASRKGNQRRRNSNATSLAPPNRINGAMDVFGAGCVIAELVLEAPIFSLSQLFRYRRGEYDPAISHLSRIPDRDFAELIGHMIQLDPDARLSAEEYLERYRGRVFPDYFYSFLHQYMEVITDPSSGQYPASGATRNLGEADERIDRVFYDFDKISYFLGFQDPVDSSAGGSGSGSGSGKQQQSIMPSRPPRPPRLGLGLLPVRLSIPTKEHNVCAGAQPTADNGALIFLTLIVASIRNTARSASRIRACDVLLAFAERLTDEARLDRVLPYLMALLNDRSDMVVVAAVRSITQLLALVRTVSPVNAHVFLEYIMPRMQATILKGSIGGGGGGREASPVVRATYAVCLGSLATMASHFLEMAAKVDRMTGAGDDTDGEGKSGSAGSKAEGGEGGGDVAGVTLDGLFDAAQRDLFEIFEQHTKALIEDADPYVRRAFLTSVPELCLFFGAADANDIIVTHLNTYLNDRDWMLRCAFFDTIVGVATFLGSVSLEEFILPLMIQSLTDPEEHVVQAVLQALAELAEVGLFSKQMVWELVEVVSRFTVHPNIWIREAAARFLSAATRFLSPAQARCLFMPLVAPYLKPGLSALRCSELDLLDHLQRSLSRPVFEQALSWAMKTDRGLFWKPLQKLRGFPFGMSSSSGPSGRAARDAIPRSLARVARNEEDEQWISRLRNLGLTAEDEFKLMALREFVWRLGRLKLHDPAAAAAAAAAAAESQSAAPNFNNIVPLRSLGITVQTVLFDDEPQRQMRAASLAGSLAAAAAGTTTATNFDSNAPRSIEDALQDASMTIDDPIARRRRAALNIHRSRLGRRGGSSSPSPALRDGFLAPAGAEAVAPSFSSSPADETAETAPPPLSSSLASSPSSTSSPLLTTAADEAASLSSRRSKAALLRHRPSAMSLLNRKDSVKSGPETATTEANAFGQVEGRSALVSDIPTRSPAPSDDLDSTVAGATYSDAGTGAGVDAAYRAHHTYTGSDPNVLKMLDAMYHENYPHDVAEFSPMVVPVSRRKMAAAAAATTTATTAAAAKAAAKAAAAAAASSSGSQAGQDIWRPAGQMVATFSEHSGAINRVVVSPDHAFFLTGGDDGTVRVWDTQRLERNISHRSRQVYRHAGGGRVLALCFIENTHCFVSCASDGTVHVIKVEYVTVAGGMPRYNRLRPLREYQLPRDEWAVWCEHFKQEASSVLVLATNRSRVLGIDLRTMTLLFALANPVHHGTPTCFAVDRRRNWLVVATSHGVLDLWDLRFKMRLKGWGVPGGAPIYRLAIHPSKGRGKWLCVAGGTGHGEVTVWDLEKTLCREVYRVGGSGGGGGGGTSNGTSNGTSYGNGIGNGTSNANRENLIKGYEPWDVDEDRPESMLGRFATSLDPAAVGNGTVSAAAAAAAAATASSGGGSLGLSTLGGGDKGVRAMVVGSAAMDDQRDVRHAFIITGGSDKRLRFWDLSRVENSLVYSGLLPDEPRPTFSSIQVTTAMTVNTERLPRVASNGNGNGNGDSALSARKGSSAPSTASSKAKGRSGGSNSANSANNGNNSSSSNSNSNNSSRPSRSTVIAMQQQLLLRSHLDAILDAALIESPYTATVSVDRMGVIFVFS